jgi:hypothetical protein
VDGFAVLRLRSGIISAHPAQSQWLIAVIFAPIVGVSQNMAPQIVLQMAKASEKPMRLVMFPAHVDPTIKDPPRNEDLGRTLR